MTDIQTLFDRDPLKLTNEELDEQIAYLRDRRHQFVAGNLTAGKLKAAKIGEGAANLKDKLNIKL